MCRGSFVTVYAAWVCATWTALAVGVAGCGGIGETFPDSGLRRESGPGTEASVGDNGLPGDGTKPWPYDGKAPDGTKPCVDKCTKGVAQCVGSQIQSCAVQATGCADWSKPADCTGGKACNGGKCPTCTDDCAPFGNTQCSLNKVQKCGLKSDGSGCYGWGPVEDCPGGAPCAAGKCPTCIDQCTSGKQQCAATQIQTCAKGPSGCLEWGAPANCGGGGACAGDKCPTCISNCTANTGQCAAALIKKCELGGDGCYHYGTAQACPGGKTCVADACPGCTDSCTLTQTKCSGALVQTCELQASGCSDWSVAAACAGGGPCTNNSCGGCTPADHRCNGSQLELCNSQQQWQLSQFCGQGCDPKTLQCQIAASCTVGTRRCNLNQVQVCNATGTAWLTAETCTVACQGGLCTGACTAGAKRCNGQVPETCNTAGTAWTSGTTCTTFCYKGDCAQPLLTVDADATKTLDGELVYAGDVVIKNKSTVTVPSGTLIIRAKKFILDSNSSITVAALGNDPRGKGSDGGSKSCTASYGYVYSGTVGGGGGGYSATGSGASQTVGSYYTCTISSSGGAAYGIADDEAASGATGGSCSGTTGGKGGGMIAIYAEEILIQGTITANGQSGSGCAGGGSGGGILLRATNTLTFTGSASASPGVGGSSGAGGGAPGVIKLLYGNAKTNTGTTTGKVFASYMPPNDLSSATHPDPARWYNDGFGGFEVAWSKPFSQSGGYYYVLNTTHGFVPAPANALYQSTETLAYPQSKFGAGSNFVHLSVVGPVSDPSTIESRYLVKVNSTACTMSSQSHPSETTWYANTTPFLQWTVPNADENTSNFYWVLDRFYDTLPDKGANKIPMNLADPASSKRLLLPVAASGIWFFHVIAEDTMGYLTKQAARFRMQIGADPGKGGVSGTITGISGGNTVPLASATVSLNRGVHTTTTNASGQYAFTNNTVFAQDYEVLVTATGYKPATQTITVKSTQTTTVNVTLQP